MKRFLFAAAAAALMSVSAPAIAATYNCKISPKKGVGLYTGVTPTRLRVTISSGGRVVVSDNVIKKAGRQSVDGTLGRKIGKVQIFSWKLSPVPRSMLPPTETKFYEPTVNYRARLDTKTGKFSMRGSFVTRVSSANGGVNMQGFGTCRRG
ncbi:hypothetical protein [Litoreibacter janthinus]|uniref:Uncharacterized protein n=1 Tax=Litoreibacter janthinus TaxID=670154 RepID=A0A1I6GXR5_9RHOB|nr:hypothetical protein [Litoreibacter janthinus]SFR47053.1 hypothetical protein SAMN04488002_2138 [Litoreibacter janthinus]